MEQYINKDAVVAEMEKRQRMLDLDNPFGMGGMIELQLLKDKIDTLETKEVNLEKEISKYLGDDWKKDADGKIESEMIAFAKHFFELGIKAKRE